MIQNVRNGGLESALHGMPRANNYLDILQDTKITYGVYAWESVGFFVVVLGALILHRCDLRWNPILRVFFQNTVRPPPPMGTELILRRNFFQLMNPSH